MAPLTQIVDKLGKKVNNYYVGQSIYQKTLQKKFLDILDLSAHPYSLKDLEESFIINLGFCLK